MTASSALSPARPLGRPRDPQRDAAIVGAALELLAESGYDALSVEGVAARAGVGKATVYRRYAGKAELVVDAVAGLVEAPEPLVGASVRDELVALLDAVRRRSATSVAGAVFPRLIAAGIDHPELLALYRSQVLAPRRERLRELLRRGMGEGLLRGDLDVDRAIDLLVAPLAYRTLVRTDAEDDPRFAEHVVDDLLRGLAL